MKKLTFQERREKERRLTEQIETGEVNVWQRADGRQSWSLKTRAGSWRIGDETSSDEELIESAQKLIDAHRDMIGFRPTDSFGQPYL